MEIQISKNKKIISKDNMWIYCCKFTKPQKPAKSAKNQELIYWKEKWFFPTIEICYESMLNALVISSEKKTLTDAVEDGVKQLKAVKEEIIKISRTK